jgi:hypothetical protein
MQHNVPAAIFSLGTIFCVRQSSALSARHAARLAACFSRLPFLPCTRTSLPYTTIFVTHGNTVCVRHVFRVSVKRFSGEKVRCAVSVRAEPSNVRAARQFHSRRRRRCLLRSRSQQMAALNFVNFFCEMICQN